MLTLSAAQHGRAGGARPQQHGPAPLCSIVNRTPLHPTPKLPSLPGAAVDQLGPGSRQHAELGAAVSSALAIALLVGLAQAALLGGLGAGGLAVWGAGPGSSLHAGQVPVARCEAGIQQRAAPRPN